MIVKNMKDLWVLREIPKKSLKYDSLQIFLLTVKLIKISGILVWSIRNLTRLQLFFNKRNQNTVFGIIEFITIQFNGFNRTGSIIINFSVVLSTEYNIHIKIRISIFVLGLIGSVLPFDRNESLSLHCILKQSLQ